MERSWRAAPLLGVFAGLALLAAGCTPKTTEPAASSTVVAPSTGAAARYRRSGPQGIGTSSGPIARIGAAVSLTGSAMQFGVAQRNGIKLAQDEINASHML